MISAAALIALALTIIGGAGMSAALSAPVLALLGVHSLAAAGGVITGLSTVQKIYAASLLVQVASKAVQTGQRLQPLQEAILAKLQDDIARAKASAALPQHGGMVAHHVGGPMGWGRAPVTFYYEPNAYELVRR